MYVQIARIPATPNIAIAMKPLFWFCYIDFFLNDSVFTSGSFLRMRPSNLMRFSLYGCKAPSKTEGARRCQHVLAIPNTSAIQLTLQPLQPRLPQPILRQHPTDRPLQNLPASPLPHHPLHVQRLQRPGPRGLLVVQLLLHLPPRRVDVGAPGGHDVVPAVRRRVPDRLVLAHEDDGDLRGQAAEGGCGWGGQGDVMPCAGVGEARLMGEMVSGGGEEGSVCILCRWSATCLAQGHRCIEEGDREVLGVRSKVQSKVQSKVRIRIDQDQPVSVPTRL